MSEQPDRAFERSMANFVARIVDWWSRTNEFGDLSPDEVERVAGEFGMTSTELRELAAKGPDATDLLYQRLAALGLNRTDVDHMALSLMRDLEHTCANCQDKGVCRHDLVAHPDHGTWTDYCPNAITLESIQKAKRAAVTRTN